MSDSPVPHPFGCKSFGQGGFVSIGPEDFWPEHIDPRLLLTQFTRPHFRSERKKSRHLSGQLGRGECGVIEKKEVGAPEENERVLPTLLDREQWRYHLQYQEILVPRPEVDLRGTKELQVDPPG